MQSRVRYSVIGVVVAILIGAGVFWSQRGYGEIGNIAYEHAKALYSICNRRDAARLESFAAQVETAAQAGELSEQEAAWLQGIVSQARDEEWTSATRESRRLLEDQVVGW